MQTAESKQVTDEAFNNAGEEVDTLESKLEANDIEMADELVDGDTVAPKDGAVQPSTKGDPTSLPSLAAPNEGHSDAEDRKMCAQADDDAIGGAENTQSESGSSDGDKAKFKSYKLDDELVVSPPRVKTKTDDVALKQGENGLSVPSHSNIDKSHSAELDTEAPQQECCVETLGVSYPPGNPPIVSGDSPSDIEMETD